MTALDDIDVIDALEVTPNSFVARALAALRSVLALHASIEAMNLRYGNVQKVCVACGTDDGNWQLWPCPTVRLIEEGFAPKQDAESGNAPIQGDERNTP